MKIFCLYLNEGVKIYYRTAFSLFKLQRVSLIIKNYFLSKLFRRHILKCFIYMHDLNLFRIHYLTLKKLMMENANSKDLIEILRNDTLGYDDNKNKLLMKVF